MSDAKRDGNRVTTIQGVSSLDDTTPISIRVGVNSKAQYMELVDTNGDPVSIGGGTEYTEDAAAAANPIGNALIVIREDARAGSLTNADGDNVAVRGNNKGEMYVKTTDSDALLTTIDSDTSALAGTVSGSEVQVDIVGSLPAGTNAIGKLAANSGVDIGDVDIASIAAGDNNIGNVDIVSGTITTVSTLTGGGIAHDSADSGNPHKIGFKAYSPDGTAPGTAVAEGDRTDAKSDLDGRLLISDEHPMWWSYHEDSSNALTDATVQAAPGSGFQIVVTEIMVSTGHATALNVFFEEGSTKVLGPWYLEAVAGRGLFWKGKKHITANTALTITTSAAIAHGIDIQGYIQKV